jgi:hypothetical protein
MQNIGNYEMPLLTELLTTVNHIGHEATAKALTNARNKGITLDDPVIQKVVNAVLEEMAISYEQLISKGTRGIKQRHGIIIISWGLLVLEYSSTDVGKILGGRSRWMINRYHKMMREAKNPARLFQYREKFSLLIKTLKQKKNKHETKPTSAHRTGRKK